MNIKINRVFKFDKAAVEKIS